MKLFAFNCNNYYEGRKTYLILAETSVEAEEILQKEDDTYIKDEETDIDYIDEISLDKAGLIMRC